MAFVFNPNTDIGEQQLPSNFTSWHSGRYKKENLHNILYLGNMLFLFTECYGDDIIRLVSHEKPSSISPSAEVIQCQFLDQYTYEVYELSIHTYGKKWYVREVIGVNTLKGLLDTRRSGREL